MTSRSQRDPVSTAQEKVVISKSGNMCAYTGCGQVLVADAEHILDRDKPLGKVAHIYAASTNGPRGNSSMTKEERGKASNLIYLCARHHDIVDSQLNAHPAELLITMKHTHEESIKRTVRFAHDNVNYSHLEVVCTVVGSQIQDGDISDIELSMPTLDKIRLNLLGPESEQQIREGLAQASKVTDFLAFQSRIDPHFQDRLVARFRVDYQEALAFGLNGDDAFEYVKSMAMDHSTVHNTPEDQAAALSVVSLMFEICEIFDHD